MVWTSVGWVALILSLPVGLMFWNDNLKQECPRDEPSIKGKFLFISFLILLAIASISPGD